MISSGLTHKIPNDFKEVLSSSTKSLLTWEDITPLARNEWICWITSAKKIETRKKRIRIALENLKKGKRRPCCWSGCTHR
ncbi:MAG: YdeI/OmpD-associated family protein [Candidatus Paceibacterota bacterium]